MNDAPNTPARQRRRHRLAGAAIFAALVLGAAAGFGLAPALLAGLAGWGAVVLLFREAGRGARIQAGALLLAGGLAFAWLAWHGRSLPVGQALGVNAQLIAMLAAVSFLRLVTRPGGAGGSTQTGPGATVLGVHLFGAVINLSTVFIMAHRMAAEHRLDTRQLRALTRGFSAAAFWSPFFAAMAAALTYSPGARLVDLMSVGVPVAALALLITFLELRHAGTAGFVGYPLRASSLALPAALAAAVLGSHAVWPEVPVLALIAVLAPSVAALVLWLGPSGRPAQLPQHVVHGLPRMVNELLLFLSAGVMAAGLSGVLEQVGGTMPFDGYAGAEAGMTLVCMVLLSLVGVHPVIGIALFSTALAPLDPDPSLQAMTFLAGWAIGVAVSPLSGMNLAISGAYGVRPATVVRVNGPYAAVMCLAATIGFTVYAGSF